MGDRIANPKALGFSAFAIVAWMYSLANAGLSTPAAGGTTMTEFTTFALFALFIVALASFLRNETWYAVFFMFWAAFLWGLHASMGAGTMSPSAFSGWYEITVAIISLFLLLAAMRIAAGPAVTLLNLGITLVFVCFALGNWLGGHFWVVIAGYLGLITGLAALWAAWNEFAAIGGEAGAA
jgi:succinate-acetate transporter protein